MKDTKEFDMEGFTLPMAFMDLIPVLFFSIGAVILAIRLKSTTFMIAMILVAAAGLIKVSWKFVLALFKKDVRILNKQMRFVMPAGFILAIIALIIDHDKCYLLKYLIQFPSLIFVIFGCLGIAYMVWFLKHEDSKDPKANWKEQTVNSIAQFFFMLAVIF